MDNTLYYFVVNTGEGYGEVRWFRDLEVAQANFDRVKLETDQGASKFTTFDTKVHTFNPDKV